jgi:hypothetical protein
MWLGVGLGELGVGEKRGMEECAYITTPLMLTTAAVWLEKVFVPAVAKSAQADQGPAREVAVQ